MLEDLVSLWTVKSSPSFTFCPTFFPPRCLKRFYEKESEIGKQGLIV